MRRLLFAPLIFTLLSPIAASAESVWLVLLAARAMDKIEMRDLDQCHEMGKKFISAPGGFKGYQCLEGK